MVVPRKKKTVKVVGKKPVAVRHQTQTAKSITQHCIRGHFFNEVMKLPAAVKIKEITFETGFAMKRMSEPITTKMEGHGVTYLSKTDPSMEVGGKLVGTRDSMKKSIKEICSEYGLAQNTVRVRRMVVAVGKNEGTFTRLSKKLPDGDEGKLRRVTVLGLMRWDGNENEIAKACSTNKFKCKYDTQIVRTVICQEG